MGYVAQSPELFDWLRVREQISLIGGLYPGWSETRAQALCRRFVLPDDMRVRKLSPGEKQRLAIVLALAQQPELLCIGADFLIINKSRIAKIAV